uniref:mannose-6-phosphate isomerase n=1 Tax=Hydra vulgaris TaxID=6087 RepID=T2MG52_HYDVU
MTESNQILNDGVFILQCGVQCSSWGKKGEDSMVALLLKNNPSFVLDKDQNYAELWMGSHPSFPSVVRNEKGSIPLADLIKSDSSKTLGVNVAAKFNGELPYLFKVLSIDKALSIQAHPCKQLAEKLFREQPHIYKDPNHKPEMAIAITKFEALCGFRPVEEILSFFKEVKELLPIVGQSAVDNLISAEMASDKRVKQSAVQHALKEVITCLMKCDEKVIEHQLSSLVARLEDCHKNGESTAPYLGHLLLRTHKQFPGDIGCFFVYFLNHLVLEPYEAIFFQPNVPHAYLVGDIVECMASSDNVVRLGLTPKFKDVDLLLQMLDCMPQTLESTKFTPYVSAEDPSVCVYNPPVDDFSVKKIQIDRGTLFYKLMPIDGPSILLVLSGSGEFTYNTGCTNFSRGTVIFISCNENVQLVNISPNEDVLLFQAYCDMQPLE